MKTIGQILTLSSDYLKSKNTSQGRLELEHLIAHVLNISRLDLYLKFEQPLDEHELSEIRKKLKRLASGEPLAYIEEKVSFYHCELFVDKNVLIPRPETEFLVDHIVQHIQKTAQENKVLFDICTGSGCIGIAIKKALPQLSVSLSDISQEALKIAQKNAKANDASVDILCGSLLEPFAGKKADFIVSNPPYIDEQSFNALDRHVKDFEPSLALCGGKTGYEYYEQFAKTLPPYLNDGAMVWFEVGHDQAQKVKSLFENQGCYHVQIIKDLANHERIVEIRVK